jgi:hypothetical protein
MAVETAPLQAARAPDEDALTRLRRSRAEILEVARELQGYASSSALPTQFPRSRVMRALLQPRGSWLAGVGLAIALIRPRLTWRLLQWVIAQPLARRHLLPWLARTAGIRAAERR